MVKIGVYSYISYAKIKKVSIHFMGHSVKYRLTNAIVYHASNMRNWQRYHCQPEVKRLYRMIYYARMTHYSKVNRILVNVSTVNVLSPSYVFSRSILRKSVLTDVKV